VDADAGLLDAGQPCPGRFVRRELQQAVGQVEHDQVGDVLAESIGDVELAVFVAEELAFAD
jgi:hypothetical protein